ncbi:MAG: hypothetical protein D3923_13645, partial [Candidatus Electrothrix sp. AR3]|nr:hypothetical protein [Candidatus Electrothrix sp. AR3]
MKVLFFLLTIGILPCNFVFSGLLIVPIDSTKPCSPLDVPVTASDSIQDAIDNLPDEGGTVFLKAGIHKINSGIRINRSNISVTGEQGTLIKVEDGVNQPALLIGTAAATPGEDDLIRNISIANIKIDGNQLNQTSETDPSRPHIRNNGIEIRA